MDVSCRYPRALQAESTLLEQLKRKRVEARVSQNAECRECPSKGLDLGRHGLGVPGAEAGESQEAPVHSVLGKP